MINRKVLLIGFFVLIGIFSFNKIKKWGFQGHKIINRMAIFTLPSEISVFFKKNIEFITSNSTTPDSRRYANKFEGSGHYIDLEFYSETKNIESKKWNEVINLFPIDSLYKHGILPWRIIQYKYLLQTSFETKSYKNILKYASELGHYLSDAHVPLHTTKNYNGQFTNQQGIHALWETKIVALISNDINFLTGKATYISNINSFIWEIIHQSNSEIPIVLNNEKLITDSLKITKFKFKSPTDKISYTEEFLIAYNFRINNLVKNKIQQSILHLGSIWYTAWIDAGQPKLELKKFNLKRVKQKNIHECE